MLRALLIMAAVVVAAPASAFVECAGETYTGTIVTVFVNTVGSMGQAFSAEVKILPKEGDARSYIVEREEIAQFFEADDSGRAIVGLSAFVQLNYPVYIKYVGKNFDEDLTAVLRDPKRKKKAGNQLLVWKGPGYRAGDQHQFKDVVCRVALDP